MLKSKQDLLKCAAIVKQLKLLYNETMLRNRDKSIPKMLKLDQTEKDKMEGLFEALNGSIFVATTERDKIEFKDISKDSKFRNPIAEKFYEQLQKKFSIKDLKELQNFKIEYVNYPPCFEELQEAKIDINDDIETFRQKMFIVNTPNENDLMKEVAEEMGENFNFLDAETITFDLFQKVLNWAKEKEDVLLDENDAKTFLDGILTKISGAFLGKCNIQFLRKLKEHSITYNDILNELITFMGLPPFASNDSTKILHLQTNETLLTAIKVCQTLNSFSYFEEKDLFIFNPLTSLIRMEKTEKYISSTFASNTNLLIIVEKEVKKKKLQKFCKMLLRILNKPNKKVVIISNETSELISFFKTTGKLEKFIKCVPQEITFDDLTRESQNMIRKSTFINFQGKEILLDTFLNESESSKLIDSTALQNIINGEKIIIGAPIQTFTEIENACYRPRQIRLIEIEDIFFEDQDLPEKNLYVIEGKEYRIHLNLVNQRIIKAKTFIQNGIPDKEKIFIILEEFNSEDQFQQICHKQPNYCIHWLKMSGKKLIWFHSYIPLSSTTTLRNCFGYYISRKEEYVSESFFEKYIERNRAVIIADKAGMGKSTLLTSFSKVLKNGKQWIIRINLNQYTTVLEKILQIPYRNTKKLILNFDNFDTDYGKLILSSMITPENHENKTLTFENLIFQHFFTNRGILYIFDGFDEINPDYGEMILALVDALRINENNRIWIASRMNYKTILEEKFNTFAYDIKPFDRNDQKIYLKQYWISKYKEEKGVEMPNQYRLSLYVREVLDKASENIRDIIGIPLQTKMYAEVLQKKNNDVISDTWISCFEYVEAEVRPKNLNISTKLNLTMLYEKFFKEKIGKYYLYEKGILERSKPDSKGLEKKEEEAEYFYHKIFGYLALVGQSDEETLLTEIENRQINNWYTEFNDGRKKMGIIDNFKDSPINPLFNHYTYAEYFAACYLIEKLTLSTNRIKVFNAADEIFEKDVPVFTECFLFKLKQVTDDKGLNAELNMKNILNFVVQHGFLRCINLFLQENDLCETFSNIDKSGETILRHVFKSNNIDAVSQQFFKI
uniref:NACHT domain-containing protein n=1 Tax=Panagrolaimus davidi TaxID=227884 RepID=A0A914Q3R3_9BILA